MKPVDVCPARRDISSTFAPAAIQMAMALCLRSWGVGARARPCRRRAAKSAAATWASAARPGGAGEDQLGGRPWLTTGDGKLRIAKAEAETPVDDAWQDVVEASFTPASPDAALTAWAGEADPVPLLLDVAPYRVRLCASLMDEARQQDTVLVSGGPIDTYLLVF